jgi:hypothetical protein
MRNNFFCATGGASYLTLRFSEREEFGRKIAGMALRLVAPGRLAGHAIFEERIPQKLFSALVTICAGGACASGGDVACYLGSVEFLKNKIRCMIVRINGPFRQSSNALSCKKILS